MYFVSECSLFAVQDFIRRNMSLLAVGMDTATLRLVAAKIIEEECPAELLWVCNRLTNSATVGQARDGWRSLIFEPFSKKA